MWTEPRASRAFPALWPALATAMLLGACALPAPPAPVASPSPPPPAPLEKPAPAPQAGSEPGVPPAPAVAMPVQGGLPGAAAPDSRTMSAALLNHADRLRRLTPPELALEVARLSEIPEAQRQPADDIQLALALAQTRAPADLVRAQALLQRVLANPREDVRGLQPLAALLAARYAEQRRVEEQMDKMSQQLKDQQRRIEQLNERLEAVRAIERSLTSRPAPANGPHRAVQP